MEVRGGCHCGAIKYRAVVDPEQVSLCHCTDCQTLSGSPYRASVPAASHNFQILTGTPRIYVKTADSGTQRAHAFCSSCGAPVYSSGVTNPTTYSLRVGCLEQRGALPPRRQIWCRSAVGWSANIGGLPARERQ